MSSTVSSEVIKNFSLFSGLSESEKNALIKTGQIHSCARGQMLFAHGQPVTHFYVIIQGIFQLFRTSPEGHQKTIEVLNPGQSICESEIMDSCRNHRVNAVAVQDSVVLQFPVSWLKDAAKKHSAFALNLLSMISSQAHRAELEAEQRASMSAAQLVACFMQRLCVLYDFHPGGFDLPYSKSLIASRLGMEIETFSRTLVKLKEHGILVNGTHVIISDLDRVEQYVCGFCSVADECPTHQAMEKKTASPPGKAGIA